MTTEKEKITQWIRQNRFSCPQYGIWLIGREPNTQEPELFDKAALKVLIFRLSPYNYVSASMSHGLLGELTAVIPGVYVDYGFMPPPKEAGLMQQDGIPPLFGTTSRQPARAFDILAISNSLGQELFNLAFLLTASGIPVEFETRIETPALPLIIMGGANALSAFITCQPAPGSGKSLVDALYLGEAEVSWQAIVETLKTARQKQLGKRQILQELAGQFPAIYTPAAAEQDRAHRVYSEHLTGVRSLTRNPLWYNKETLGYSNITIDRGCPFLCYFCKDAWERRPYRQRPVGDILADLSNAKKYQGLDTINFFSSNFSSYREAAALIREARQCIGMVAVKSQRFDTLSTNNQAAQMQQIGKSSYTFGLEGISQRIRNFLNKNITASQVLETLDLIFSHPLRQVKIFLIITGLETGGDLAELDKLLLMIRQTGKARKAKGEIPVILSLTPFIPMPHTPMQFHPFPDPRSVKKCVRDINQLGITHNILVRESISVEEARLVHWLNFATGAQVENLLKAGSRYHYVKELNPAILDLFLGTTPPAYAEWLGAVKDDRTVFPWDEVFVKSGEEKVFLYKLYQKALEQLGAAEPAEKKAALPAEAKPEQIKVDRLESLMFWFRVETSQELAGVPQEFFQASLARQLCLQDDARSRLYLRQEHYFDPGGSLPFYGQVVFSLSFLEAKTGDTREWLKAQALTLESPWGWELSAVEDRVHNHQPGGIILLYEDLPCLREKELWLFTGILRENNIKHQVRNAGGAKLFLIDNQSSNLAQCLYFIIDKKHNTLCFALKLPGAGQAGSPARSLLSFFRKSAFEYLLHTPGRIMSFWNKNTGKKCPVCKKNELADAFSGEKITGTPCDFFCKR